ncbi:hypothetical protein QFC21_005915 [Naganishia friedmannii]|uniref:Uncharacterized protein n=1 Tax=Naganishia friedmannii TaxID=89922 RepID=A0ACC2V858_9TREE|nr:hypothetical protein QFC21_005915 [Naganishia friedmannii]
MPLALPVTVDPATQQTTPSSWYHNNPLSAPLPNASPATEEEIPSHMTEKTTAIDQSQYYSEYIPGSEAQFGKEDQGRQDSMAVNAPEQTQGQNRENVTYQVQQLLLAYELQQVALKQQIEVVQRQHALQLVSPSFRAFECGPQFSCFRNVGSDISTLEDPAQARQAVRANTLATQNGSTPDTESQNSENTTQAGHAAERAKKVAVKAENFQILGLGLPEGTQVDFKYSSAVRQRSQIRYVQALTGKRISGSPYRLTFSSHQGRFTKKGGSAHYEIQWVVSIAQTVNSAERSRTRERASSKLKWKGTRQLNRPTRMPIEA